MPTLRVIGPGRAGGALSLALARSGWEISGARRRGDVLHDAAADVDLLVIATPDSAIAEIAAEVEPDRTGRAVVAHLAGSLGLDALAPHSRTAAIHPLVALPSATLGAQRLASGVWFAVAGDALADRVVDDLDGLGFTVADPDRALYHAAACIASNHLVALLGQVARLADSANVPMEAYLDLVRATIDNVADLGAKAALTGPAARGDWQTIERHRDALRLLGDDELQIYDAMVRAVGRLVDGTEPGQGSIA